MGGCGREVCVTAETVRCVSVVVPALDEEATIERVAREVAAVFARDLPHLRLELVLVDDGSRDGTPDAVARLAADLPGLRTARHPAPRGKGAALGTGFALASGDVVVVQDADLEYRPADLPRLLEPIERGVADVVYGSRFTSPARRVGLYWTTLANQLITLATNVVLDTNFSDVYTGYKAIRRDFLRRFEVESRSFTVEVELTAKLRRLGARFYEVPIQYHARGWDEGKKIRLLDAVRALGAIVRFRFASLRPRIPSPATAGVSDYGSSGSSASTSRQAASSPRKAVNSSTETDFPNR
jgi:glycosyltransferase involved in cell wall biosynthesis